jgi:hypothetical protein
VAAQNPARQMTYPGADDMYASNVGFVSTPHRTDLIGVLLSSAWSAIADRRDIRGVACMMGAY